MGETHSMDAEKGQKCPLLLEWRRATGIRPLSPSE